MRHDPVSLCSPEFPIVLDAIWDVPCPSQPHLGSDVEDKSEMGLRCQRLSPSHVKVYTPCERSGIRAATRFSPSLHFVVFPAWLCSV